MNTDFVTNPNSLNYLLKVSDRDDLDILVDYITDKGEGRITLDDNICQHMLRCKEAGNYSEADRTLISHEIRRFGGNTLSNFYRDARNAIPFGSLLDNILPDVGNTIGYNEIVRDVASHLKVSINASSDVPTMEDGILRKILTEAFEKMSSEDRKAVLEELNIKDISTLKPIASGALIVAGRMAGFTPYKLALIVANAIAKAILGKGLTLGGNVIVVRTLGVLLGPIGWVLTGLWTLADMASPAYRVTVPCVVQIAYMRQKALVAAYATRCEKCGSPNNIDVKFCAECGAPMQIGSVEQSAPAVSQEISALKLL